MVRGSIVIRDGYLELPERPGWGVEIDEELLTKYPYQDRNFLRLFQPGWERRTGQAEQ